MLLIIRMPRTTTIRFHFSRKREILLVNSDQRISATLLFLTHARDDTGLLPLSDTAFRLLFLTHARDDTATLSSLIPYRIFYPFARLVIFTSHRAYKIVFD